MGKIKEAIATTFLLPIELMDPLGALKAAIQQNEGTIKDLNRQQMDTGRDSKGKSLGRYARFSYKNRWEPIDLKLTGDFRERMEVQVDDKETEIFSQDRKSPWLEKRYGKDIFGLTRPLLDNAAAAIKPDMVANARKKIFK